MQNEVRTCCKRFGRVDERSRPFQIDCSRKRRMDQSLWAAPAVILIKSKTRASSISGCEHCQWGRSGRQPVDAAVTSPTDDGPKIRGGLQGPDAVCVDRKRLHTPLLPCNAQAHSLSSLTFACWVLLYFRESTSLNQMFAFAGLLP